VKRSSQYDIGRPRNNKFDLDRRKLGTEFDIDRREPGDETTAAAAAPTLVRRLEQVVLPPPPPSPAAAPPLPPPPPPAAAAGRVAPTNAAAVRQADALRARVFKLQQQVASRDRAIDDALDLIAEWQGRVDARGRQALQSVRDILQRSRK
jgi:hypothetical protein